VELFELGYADYPTAYSSSQNLAWGLELRGEPSKPLDLAEARVEDHPDHELGLRRVTEPKQARAAAAAVDDGG